MNAEPTAMLEAANILRGMQQGSIEATGQPMPAGVGVTLALIAISIDLRRIAVALEQRT